MDEILPCYTEIIDGNLFWDGTNILEVAKDYGTPFIIYSENILRGNYRKIKNAFNKYLKNVSIDFAIKSNFNPSLISILSSEGCGMDASSINEIKIALLSGVSPDNISFTPNNVTLEELKFAIDNNIIINFDSLGQFRLLLDHLPEIVSFRIKIDYGRGEFPGIKTAGKGAKFGEIPELALQGYREAKEKGCRKFGIHVMAGSNVRNADHFKLVAQKILEVVKNFEEELGIEFEFVDMGGGFGVPYRPEEGELDVMDTAKNIADVFKAFYTEKGREIPRLVIEPGRYISSNSGLLVGKITDVKRQESNFTGTDIGMNILMRPALYGAYHHILIANRMNEERKFKTDVTGQICENTDRIGKDVMLQEPQIGDIVAVFNCGAYTMSMASNYNGRLLPMELLISDGKIIKIREEDNFQDIVRHTKFYESAKTLKD
ncbi:MAG: diaminopimelate decarboxylase [Cuniculiplasma divulgatum]